MERRQLQTQYKAEGRTLTGYASVFGSPTSIREKGRTFTEQVRPGAFARSLSKGGDVLCLFNHDIAKYLGRTSAKTLSIEEDDKGLRFTVELPETVTGEEVRALAERGDLQGASFTFTVRADKWDGNKRELIDVDLHECGPVLTPAYEDAKLIGLRSKYRTLLNLHERI